MTERISADQLRRDESLVGKSLALRQRISQAHEQFRPRIEASGVARFAETDDRSYLSPEVEAKHRYQTEILKRVHRIAESPKVLASIAERAEIHRRADLDSESLPPHERIARRLSMYKGLLVITDMDNTMTDHPKQEEIYFNGQKTPGVDEHLLGSAALDPHIGKKRQNFPELYSAAWQDFLKEHPDLFAEGGNLAVLREGMADLFSDLFSRQDTNVAVVSMNFRPFVRAVLDRVPGYRDAKSKRNPRDIREIAITSQHIISSAKGDVIRILASRPENKDKAIVYIGDGGSDRPAAEAHEVVAGYFALDNEGFHRQLKEQGLLHMSYRTGHEIHEVLSASRKRTRIFTEPTEVFNYRQAA